MPEDHGHVRRQVLTHLDDLDSRLGPKERVGLASPVRLLDGKLERPITKGERLAFVAAAVGWGKRMKRALEVVRLLPGGQVALVFGAREVSGG